MYNKIFTYGAEIRTDTTKTNQTLSTLKLRFLKVTKRNHFLIPYTSQKSENYQIQY